MRPRFALFFRVFVCALSFACAPLASTATGTVGESFGNPFDETVRLLERWTTSHWGRDCFVWIVHYPEALIEPWVNAEALRVGMTEAERQAYRENFVSELRFGNSEPFLLTVYSFGARPVSLAPISKNVALVTASGERVKPVRYDSNLDRPTHGVVQGLVFFPKQHDADFAVAVKGMGVHDERIFAFGRSDDWSDSAPLREEERKEDDVVVVNLPKKKSAPPAPKKALPPKPKEIKPPHVPVAPLVHPPRPPVPLPEEESSDMALFVEQMRGKGAPQPERPTPESQNAYVSRERVLRQFLDHWVANRPKEMYAMLSSDSQKMLAAESFEKEVRRATDFRAALKGGYRIDWIGDERAKVIADRRFLMIRTLATRTLGVVREEQIWKIVW